MHEGQLTPSLDQVAKLIAAQFPEWADLPLREVHSHGTVNALFRIGDQFVARLRVMPGDPAAVRAELHQEAETAETLLRSCCVPTPVPVAVGEPGHGYPLPWAVYRWLPGMTAHEADLADSPKFARELAEFVLTVRAIPTAGRTFGGHGRGGSLRDHDDWVALCLARSTGMTDVGAVAAMWAALRDTPSRGADVWTHNDLMPNNLLVDKDLSLAAVIDVGQAGPADPAVDLQPAWNLFGPAARRAYREVLGVDDHEWDRGRAWAVEQALGCLWYYRETNPVASRIAARTLGALLEDADSR